MKKKINLYILLVLVVIFMIVKAPSWFKSRSFTGEQSFRDTNHLILSKDVICKMDCFSITIDEIKHVLKTGYVNNAKTGIGSQGDSTFALDGYSPNKQHIRVMVAPEQAGLLVVSCADLKKNELCNCD